MKSLLLIADSLCQSEDIVTRDIVSVQPQEMDSHPLSCTRMVDDFNNKMWTRCGKTDTNGNELYSIAERLNDSCDFECFAMRDDISKTCGLAVIVPNGYFNTEKQVEEFVNDSS